MEIIYSILSQGLWQTPQYIYIYISNIYTQYIETMHFHLAIFCNLLGMVVLSDPKSKVKGDQPNDWGFTRSRVTWITSQLWFPYTSTYDVHRYHILPSYHLYYTHVYSTCTTPYFPSASESKGPSKRHRRTLGSWGWQKKSVPVCTQ